MQISVECSVGRVEDRESRRYLTGVVLHATGFDEQRGAEDVARIEQIRTLLFSLNEADAAVVANILIGFGRNLNYLNIDVRAPEFRELHYLGEPVQMIPISAPVVLAQFGGNPDSDTTHLPYIITRADPGATPDPNADKPKAPAEPAKRRMILRKR